MVIHVAVGGRDTNTGSKRSPLASLKAARDALRRAGPLPNKRIVIHGGEYFDVSLELGPQDSGLTVEAAASETPVLYGGHRVSGWKKDGKKFYSVPLPGIGPGGVPPRHLLVAGRFAPRARLPEKGYFRHNTVWNVPHVPIGDGCGWQRQPTRKELTTLKYAAGDLGAWLDVNNAEFAVSHLSDDSIVPVRHVDARTRTVTFARPCLHPPGSFRGWNERWNRYVVWNVREGMCRPGQWYLDHTRGKLVYWPRAGEDMDSLEVIAPTARNVIRIRSDRRGLVRNVKIKGLSFTATTTRAESPFWGGWRVDGALAICGGQNIVLEALSFDRLGGTGIRARGSTDEKIYRRQPDETPLKRLRVRRCRLNNCGGAGIYVWGDDCEITNNTVRQIGLDCVGAVGIGVEGDRCRIDHNLIHSVPYVGIAAGGSDGRITHNLLRDFMLRGDDGGAIYVYGDSRRYLVRQNAAYGSSRRRMAHAYYTDERSADHRIEYNLAVGTRWPLHTHIACGHRIRNNVFINAGESLLTFYRSRDIRFRRNVVIGKSIRIRMPEGALASMAENVFASGDGKVTLDVMQKDGYEPIESRILSMRDGSIVAEAGLIGPEAGRCTFAKNSPALGLGIKPLDVSAAGVCVTQ